MALPKPGRMRDVNLGYNKKSLLVGRGVGGGGALFGLFLFCLLLTTIGGGGISRRLILREQADCSHEERQAERQSHDFLHFDLLK